MLNGDQMIFKPTNQLFKIRDGKGSNLIVRLVDNDV